MADNVADATIIKKTVQALQDRFPNGLRPLQKSIMDGSFIAALEVAMMDIQFLYGTQDNWTDEAYAEVADETAKFLSMIGHAL